MPHPPPKLRLHASGNWFVHWGGAHHYLGRDRQIAQTLYANELTAWAAWRAQAGQSGSPGIPRPSRRARATPPRTLAQLHAEWLQTIRTDAGNAAESYYTRHTVRFIAAWGQVPANTVRPPQVRPAAWLAAL